MESIRNQILSKVPHLEQKFWSYFDSAISEMSHVAWTKILPNVKSYDPLAFVTRSKGLTGVYEIYVNPNVPSEAKEPLQLHEMGHVIFSHMSLQKTQRDIVIHKIMSYWVGFQKYLDLSKYSSKDIKNVATGICNAILNIAMDYEVNSKLFTKEEWETFVEYANWAYIQAMAKSEEATDDALQDVLKKLEEPTDLKTNKIFNPCWPEDSGFPTGLNYKQYIDLILLNQDKFFDTLKKKMSGSGNNDGNGNGGDENDTTDNSEGSFEPLSYEEIEKIRAQYSDTDAEKNEAIRDAESENESKREANNRKGFSPIGASKKTDVIDISKDRLLEECLKKYIFSRSVEYTKSDIAYYYNRRKYGGNVLITRNVSQNVYVPGNVYLLVDCSGSIGYNTLSILIGAVKNVAKGCGQNSRIIWWNTELVNDSLLRKCGTSVATGGTDIASGIEYVKKRYLKEDNSILIIISDYQDTLNGWYKSVKDLKCSCLGICWVPKNRVDGMKGRDIIKEIVDHFDSTECQQVDRLFDKLPTTFVKV